MFDQMDDLLTEKRPVDEKPTSSSALPCPSRVDQSPVCSNIFKGALDAAATVEELNWIFALTMREAAGVDDCWTHDVIGDWQEIAKGKVSCECAK